MPRAIVSVAAIIAAAAIAALIISAFTGRYRAYPTPDYCIRMDTWTGATSYCAP